MSTTEHKLSPPSLEELASVLAAPLQANYTSSSIAAVPCPDLRLPPFNLACEGLSGHEAIADVGGQPHLFPRPLLDKTYSMLECARHMHLSADRGTLLGAGAGPCHILGRNSELATNLSWNGDFGNVTNFTRFVIADRIAGGEADVSCDRSLSTDCALMMNLYGSDGRPGPVLKVTARGRKGEGKSFTEFLRTSLNEVYGNEHQISMGGVVFIKKGLCQFHVMPDFPSEADLPFKDRGAVNEWLTHHRYSGPLTCLTVFHSCDPEGLGLRMEHTHGYSEDRAEGGHYHYDIAAGEDDADEVEYEAYLNTAKSLFRIDRPAPSSLG